MKGEVPLTFVLRNISFCTFKRKGRNEKVFLLCNGCYDDEYTIYRL